MTHEEKARDWIFALIERLSKKEITEILLTMWAVWYARRKAIHESIFQSHLSTRCFIERFIADLEVNQKPASQNRPPAAPALLRWIPPPDGWVKINVDAAVGKVNNKGAAAAIVRSSDGLFLGASCVVLERCTQPETLEVLACREALSLASDLSVRRIRIASECLRVINTLHDGTMGEYAQFTREIHARSLLFDEVSFCHERRSSNMEAHKIARSSIQDVVGHGNFVVAESMALH